MSAVDIPGTGSGQDEQRPQWMITRIEDTMSVNPANPGVRMKRVYFQVLDGSESYVDVPMQQFNEQGVANAVAAHAMSINSVLGLRSAQ